MGFRWEDMRDSGQIMELGDFPPAFLLPETSLNWKMFFLYVTLYLTPPKNLSSKICFFAPSSETDEIIYHHKMESALQKVVGQIQLKSWEV